MFRPLLENQVQEGDKAVFALIDHTVTDALVIFDEAFQDKAVIDEIARNALDRGVPVISVGAAKEGCINFLFDYEKGFEQIVRHVIEYHGFTDTCFIAGKKRRGMLRTANRRLQKSPLR